ncbi:MAG TPA: hypothetical protein VIW24_27940 [Aldersonia sp.]
MSTEPTLESVALAQVRALYERWTTNPALRRGAAARDLAAALEVDPTKDLGLASLGSTATVGEPGNSQLRRRESSPAMRRPS